MEIDTLFAISPIDGRYRNITQEISEYFSEYALIKGRVFVEVKWLIKLIKNKEILKENIDRNDIEKINEIYEKFDLESAKRIKQIERKTNHDVKAVEYYIREKLKEFNLDKYLYLVHFGCTSEDISNLAYGKSLIEFVNNILIKNIKELIKEVEKNALENKMLPMLSHTHGQPATPTTVGKEFAIFVYRWKNVLEKIEGINLKGKFSSAVGNFNAFYIAYPNIDWFEFNKSFVEEIGLEFNPLTTQIESHDEICTLFSYIKLFNNILNDYNSDMWTYISKNYFKQITIETEVGSSVMPHKVNPINHENSMANLKIANSILDSFINNLQVSRMQRDLSDSSMLRNIGVALAHTIIAIKQSIIGTDKMIPNINVLEQELTNNPEILTEAVQTILRKNKYEDAYEKLKEFSRGKRVTMESLQEFIKKLDIEDEDKNRLLNLTPEKYLGIADKLVSYM